MKDYVYIFNELRIHINRDKLFQCLNYQIFSYFPMKGNLWYSRIMGSILFKVPRVIVMRTISSSAGIYLLKVNYRNTRTRCEICSKITIKIPERCQPMASFGIFIVNFEHISNLVLVFLLLTLDLQLTAERYRHKKTQWCPLLRIHFILGKFHIFKFIALLALYHYCFTVFQFYFLHMLTQ